MNNDQVEQNNIMIYTIVKLNYHANEYHFFISLLFGSPPLSKTFPNLQNEIKASLYLFEGENGTCYGYAHKQGQINLFKTYSISNILLKYNTLRKELFPFANLAIFFVIKHLPASLYFELLQWAREPIH